MNTTEFVRLGDAFETSPTVALDEIDAAPIHDGGSATPARSG